MRQRVLTLVGAVCALVAASCEGVGTREDSSVPRTGGEDRIGLARAGALRSWSTYHHDGSRSGYVATGPRQPLRRAWARRLVGAVYGEPLVVGSTLVVATERNYGYGLKARTGATSWRSRRLGTPQRLNGLPCGDVDPLGITGTPAYDRATGSVFVAAETSGGTHTLWALSAANGHRRWHRSLDTQKHLPHFPSQVVSGSWVFVPTLSGVTAFMGS